MKKIIFILSILFLYFTVSVKIAVADSCNTDCYSLPSSEQPTCLNNKIECLSNKLNSVKNEKITLTSTINTFNNSINIKEWKIKQKTAEIINLETELENINQRLDGLDISLDRLTSILVNRIQEQYKQQNKNNFFLLFSSPSFSKFINRYQYLISSSKQTADAMTRAETQRLAYDSQKKLKEEKQKQIEDTRILLKTEQNSLIESRQEKNKLLKITQNNEKKFQDLLSSAKAEFEAIQDIISKKGSDTKVGHVNEGEKIAAVIQGPSCNSGGTHMHYTITKSDGSTVNPFNYLKKVDYKNCSGPGSCSPGDSFNPTGDWNWPVSPAIRLNQGYGATWATKNTWVGHIYSFHNGIDIIGSSMEVKAVQGGTLYRGSYTGTAGCKLRYVRIDHDNGNLTSYYLHVNYY